MPFTDHLVELRQRIIVCIATVVCAFLLSFILFDRYLMLFLERPLRVASEMLEEQVPVDRLKQAISPMEPLTSAMKVAFAFALFVASPIVVFELWLFVSPGLRKSERRVVGPALIFAGALFLGGGAFAYFVVLPYANLFLLKYALRLDWSPAYTIRSFISYELLLLLAFGLIFELPLLIVILTAMGIVTPESLKRARPYSVLLAFVVGAVLTPPDPGTQIMLAVPLLVLYEVSLHLSKIFYRRRRRALEASCKHNENR